jgi:predicted membrane protein
MSARTLDGGCGLLGVVVVIVASAEGRVAAVLVLAAAFVLRGHVVAVSEHGVAAVPGVLTFFAFLSSFSFFFFAPEACALYAALLLPYKLYKYINCNKKKKKKTTTYRQQRHP